jgi:hypothetical protein
MIIYNPQTNPNDLMSPIKSTNMMMMMMNGVEKALLFHPLLLKKNGISQEALDHDICLR